MISAESENKSIELVFPRPKREMDVYLPKMKGEDFFQMFSIDVQSVAKWFGEYEMDSIELKIENIINSPQTTKLILGSKGENGGLTVVLKPNKSSSTNGSNNQATQQVQLNNKEEDGVSKKMQGIEQETQNRIGGNISKVRQVFEAFNTGNTSKVNEFISPQYFNHESQVDPIRSRLRGPEEFIDTVRALRSAFADLHYEEQETIAGEDKVVSMVNVTGKHTGTFFVIPPTGNKISYQAVHIHRIDDDRKITEHKAIRDDLSLMVQLGVIGPKSSQYESLFQAWKAWKGL